MKIAVEETFDAAHRLFEYDGKCVNIHGHTYKVRAVVEGEVQDESGMVLDFGRLKGALRGLVEYFDHALILEKNDPLADVLAEAGVHVVVLRDRPTAELLALDLKYGLEHKLNVAAENITVRVHETPTSWAEA